MVQRAGIKVSVVRYGGQDGNLEHGHVYDFYQEYMHNAQTHIKVATGEQFMVQVHIAPDFDFMGLPEAQIYCSIDDEEKFNWSLSQAELADVRSQNIRRRIHFLDTERFINGRWMKCCLTFGDLEVNARARPRSQQADRDILRLGRIVVEVRRGTGRPWGPELVWPNGCAVDTTRAARHVVEGHHISHALRVVPVRECPQPDQSWNFDPARGQAGHPETFEIIFRSQESLEQLGVVPAAAPQPPAYDEDEDEDDELQFVVARHVRCRQIPAAGQEIVDLESD
jgi:hypothetical protein